MNNNSDLIIRQATLDDIDFIIETIVESDKSSSSVVSACNIFRLSLVDYKELLREILSLDFPNNEYSLSGFLVAEINNRLIGALGSWIEGADGTSNAIYKSNLILNFIDSEKLSHLKEEATLINCLSFSRIFGTIQLEYGYVLPEYRRKGIFSKLIIESIIKLANPKLPPAAQTIVYTDNKQSFFSFRKLCFYVKEEKFTKDGRIFDYFAYNSKVMLELQSQCVNRLLDIETAKKNRSINKSQIQISI